MEPTLANLKKITPEQAEVIYFKRYWSGSGYAKINDPRVALMTYDWSITSGRAVREIQSALIKKYDSGISIDGRMGPQTVAAINSITDQDALLSDIASTRIEYYKNRAIVDPTQEKFVKGWLRRVDDCLKADM